MHAYWPGDTRVGCAAACAAGARTLLESCSLSTAHCMYSCRCMCVAGGPRGMAPPRGLGESIRTAAVTGPPCLVVGCRAAGKQGSRKTRGGACRTCAGWRRRQDGLIVEYMRNAGGSEDESGPELSHRSSSPSESTAAMLPQGQRPPVGDPEAGMRGQMSAVWRHKLTRDEKETLRNAPFPRLCIHGRQDIVAAVSCGAKVASEIAATMVVLEGAHFIPRERGHEVRRNACMCAMPIRVFGCMQPERLRRVAAAPSQCFLNPGIAYRGLAAELCRLRSMACASSASLRHQGSAKPMPAGPSAEARAASCDRLRQPHGRPPRLHELPSQQSYTAALPPGMCCERCATMHASSGGGTYPGGCHACRLCAWRRPAARPASLAATRRGKRCTDCGAPAAAWAQHRNAAVPWLRTGTIPCRVTLCGCDAGVAAAGGPHPRAAAAGGAAPPRPDAPHAARRAGLPHASTRRRGGAERAERRRWRGQCRGGEVWACGSVEWGLRTASDAERGASRPCT